MYTLLSLAVTFPLIFHLGDASAGPAADGDNLWFAWLLWVYRDGLLSGHDPNRTHTIFALLPSVQVLADAHFNLLVGIPLQWIAGPLTVYNFLVILSFILSGLTMYLLAREFVADPFACFAAGFLYDFSTYHFARAAGHFGLMTLQWLPFCAWRLFALYRRPGRINAVLAGIGIALVPLSDLYYLAYFLVPFGVLFVVGVLIVDRGWFTRARNLRMAAIALLVAIAIAGPVLADYLAIDPDERAVTQTTAKLSTEPLSADLLTFVVPSPANPFFGVHTQAIYRRVKTIYPPIETSSFLGYPILILAACALLVRRNRPRIVWFWLALGVGGIVLALGPALFVAGHRIVSLPTYRLVFGWPFLSNYRAPNRLTVLPLLSFALLSAYGVAMLRERWTTTTGKTFVLRGVIVALLIGALAQQVLWAFPYPTTRLHISPLYQEIGADKEDALLLDLPLTTSGAYQYDQSIHHKPLVNGYVPRITPRMAASVYNLPYLSQFIPTGDGTHLEITGARGEISSQGSFTDVLRGNGIKYVVMHRTVEPASYAKMRSFLIEQLGVWFYDNSSEGLTAWRVEPASSPSSDTYRVALGSGWLPGIGERNGLAERYADQDAQVIITAPRTEEGTLRFFATPILKPLSIEVRLNGQVILTTPLNAAGTTQGVQIAHVPLNAGANTVELHAVEGCVRPSDISNSPDTRCFTLGVQEIRVTSP